MFLKSIMKKPMLMIGFLFLIIVLFEMRDKGIFLSRRDKVQATSCRAVTARLEKYYHQSWDISCNQNNLIIIAPVDNKIIIKNKENKNALKKEMYKILANIYISISRYSPAENLQRTMMVSVRLTHPQLTLNSISEGRHIFNLKSMKNQNNLALHIKRTIQVQEIIKKNK